MPPVPPVIPPVPPPIVPPPPELPPSLENLEKTIEKSREQDIPKVKILSNEDGDALDATSSTKSFDDIKNKFEGLAQVETHADNWAASDKIVSEESGNLVVVSTPQADRSRINTSTVTIITDLPDPSNSLASNISQVSITQNKKNVKL